MIKRPEGENGEGEKMYEIAVVEDEDCAAAALGDAISRYERIKGEEFGVTRYPDAVTFLKQRRPQLDMVFMDIVLPYMNGMDAAAKLRELDPDVTIVFVTNIVNFAVKGYSVGAAGFIVKPFAYDVFAETMERAMSSVRRERHRPYLSVQTDGALKKVPLSDILFAEVDRHVIVYHTERGTIRTRGTMAALERKLLPEGFARCNICYLVNLRHVTEVRGADVMVGDRAIRISRARKKEFVNALTDYLGRGI